VALDTVDRTIERLATAARPPPPVRGATDRVLRACYSDRMKPLVAALVCVVCVVATRGPLLACDIPPPPFHASPTDVALADLAGHDFVIERDDVEVPGTWRIEPVRSYDLVEDGAWEYYVWTPDAPLSPDADYVLRDTSGSNERVFRAVDAPAGEAPAQQVQLDFGSVAIAVGEEYCCYGDGNTCGLPAVCVSEQRDTVAQVFVSIAQPNPAFVFRVVGARGMPGHEFFVARFAEPASTYEVVVEAVDVRTGEATVVHSATFAADPDVDYGIAAVDLSMEPLTTGNCPSPPSAQRCDSGGTPQECPAGSEAVRGAWCAQNEQCRDDPGEPRCEFFGEFCPDETEPEPGPESDTGGCSAATGGATWVFLAFAGLIVARRRRGRPNRSQG